MEEFIKKEEKTYIAILESKEVNSSTLDVEEEKDEPTAKKIEVITGDGKNLNISGVSEYIEVEKPKDEKKENIIIPEVKK